MPSGKVAISRRVPHDNARGWGNIPRKHGLSINVVKSRGLVGLVLSKHFATYSPSEDELDAVLDKRRLHDHCRAAGVDTPETHFPNSEEDAAALARTMKPPVLLKQAAARGAAPRAADLGRDVVRGRRTLARVARVVQR
jgi:hypothetical protein